MPGIPQENYWFRRHEVVYRMVAPHCRGVVLEAGCGEGYGAAQLLSGQACRVIALDYDRSTVGHVGRHYDRVDVLRGSVDALPIRSSTVDTLVSLQVIEHLWDQPGFLAECARVLRPGGRLALSTPNRLTFSPGRDTPVNPFHTRELAPAELRDLLRNAGFGVDPLLGLHHGPGLRALDARHGGSIVDEQVRLALSGAAWPGALRADVAGVRCADFEIHECGLDLSLDLIALAAAP